VCVGGGGLCVCSFVKKLRSCSLERRALRSGGNNEKLVSLPSEGEDESEASASGSEEEDQSSSGSDS